MKDKLLILLVGSILMYLTAVMFYGIGLNYIGPIPTARASDDFQYRRYMRVQSNLDNIETSLNDIINEFGTYRVWQSFDEWQTKRIFEKTLSELKMNQATNRIWKKFFKNKNKHQ